MEFFWPQSLQVLHALFMSEDAARAIVKAMACGKHTYFVRIADVRPGVGETFDADCTLLFKLYRTKRKWISEGASQFTFEKRVCVSMDKEYSSFLLGGRVLHYERRVDVEKGGGFVLWPLKRYLAYLALLQGGVDGDGAGS